MVILEEHARKKRDVRLMEIVKTVPNVIQILVFVSAHPKSISETSVKMKLKMLVLMR